MLFWFVFFRWGDGMHERLPIGPVGHCNVHGMRSWDLIGDLIRGILNRLYFLRRRVLFDRRCERMHIVLRGHFCIVLGVIELHELRRRQVLCGCGFALVIYMRQLFCWLVSRKLGVIMRCLRHGLLSTYYRELGLFELPCGHIWRNCRGLFFVVLYFLRCRHLFGLAGSNLFLRELWRGHIPIRS